MPIIRFNFEELDNDAANKIIDWVNFNRYYCSFFKLEFLEWLTSLEHYRTWTSVSYSSNKKSWIDGWSRITINFELKKSDIVEFKLRWT